MVQIVGNAVRFNFPNINLPDSNTNEPASHGYVQYKVKLKDNLPIGTEINNTAFIYFDFNAPVVTNTTANIVALVSSVEDGRPQTADNGKIQIQPNPAQNAFTVSVSENLIGEKFTVVDVTGRAVFQSAITHSKLEINTSGWESGIYFARAGNAVRKVVVQK